MDHLNLGLARAENVKLRDKVALLQTGTTLHNPKLNNQYLQKVSLRITATLAIVSAVLASGGLVADHQIRELTVSLAAGRSVGKMIRLYGGDLDAPLGELAFAEAENRFRVEGENLVDADKHTPSKSMFKRNNRLALVALVVGVTLALLPDGCRGTTKVGSLAAFSAEAVR